MYIRGRSAPSVRAESTTGRNKSRDLGEACPHLIRFRRTCPWIESGASSLPRAGEDSSITQTVQSVAMRFPLSC